MILLIDNYDSFTYNLYQYLCELGAEVEVRRNDSLAPEEVESLEPNGIVVSPGPCTPKEAGVSSEVILRWGPTIPTLGVCLGISASAAPSAGIVDRAGEIMHGKTSMVHHDGKGVFKELPDPFEAIRYHSLAVYKENLPDSLEVTAWTDNGIIMGLRHKEHPIEGIQFHPESIMTPVGKDLLQNYLDQVYGKS